MYLVTLYFTFKIVIQSSISNAKHLILAFMMIVVEILDLSAFFADNAFDFLAKYVYTICNLRLGSIRAS